MAILGIDEVGRGPWAGPLLVCACVLHKDIPGLTDSKKLTTKRRTTLAEIIKENSSYGFGWISAHELDEIGLSAALRQATHTAVQQIHHPFHEIIIDGTINFLSDTPLTKYVTTLVKADLLIPAVSAASILAKVARDTYMVELSKEYPEYHFEKHVGYGTVTHRKALETHGPCPEHRTSFKPIANLKTTAKSIGNQAEDKVATYLSGQDHIILDRNWRTKTCEIDIISIKDSTLYFTEVKYRKDPTHGSGLEAITKSKLTQMQKAATTYLKFHSQLQESSPILAVASVTDQDFTLQDFLTLS
ncbi:MAG: ribonuclease HII [Candidatus Nomurabacteria bacterium]|jgi:ribonuclease HII|nr:ribonuclease HII [Candidatus Nomurabacteria bacterium]